MHNATKEQAMHVLMYSRELHFYHILNLLVVFCLSNLVLWCSLTFVFLSQHFVTRLVLIARNPQSSVPFCRCLLSSLHKTKDNAAEFVSENLTDWTLSKVSGQHALFWIINMPLKIWHAHFKHYKTKLDSRLCLSFYVNYSVQVNLFCKWKEDIQITWYGHKYLSPQLGNLLNSCPWPTGEWKQKLRPQEKKIPGNKGRDQSQRQGYTKSLDHSSWWCQP